jgi:hypothetical protein
MPAKKSASKKDNNSNIYNSNSISNSSKNKISLDKRDDIFSEWIINSWFKENSKARPLKIIFMELFMSLYDDLSEKFNGKKRDEIFKNFINVIFPTVLDVYKWHESEKENVDIGLLRALKEIPNCAWYIDLLTSYSKHYDA